MGSGLNIADESSEIVLKDHAPSKQAQETYKVQFLINLEQLIALCQCKLKIRNVV